MCVSTVVQLLAGSSAAGWGCKECLMKSLSQARRGMLNDGRQGGRASHCSSRRAPSKYIDCLSRLPLIARDPFASLAPVPRKELDTKEARPLTIAEQSTCTPNRGIRGLPPSVTIVRQFISAPINHPTYSPLEGQPRTRSRASSPPSLSLPLLVIDLIHNSISSWHSSFTRCFP